MTEGPAGASAQPGDLLQPGGDRAGEQCSPHPHGSFHYCYNAEAVVDADHQAIIATQLTNIAVDVEQNPP